METAGRRRSTLTVVDDAIAVLASAAVPVTAAVLASGSASGDCATCVHSYSHCSPAPSKASPSPSSMIVRVPLSHCALVTATVTNGVVLVLVTVIAYVIDSPT